MKPRRTSLLSCCLLGAGSATAAVEIIAAAAGGAGAGGAAPAAVDCPRMHVFGARETMASPGFGSSQTLVDLVTDAFPGTRTEAIDYPAAPGDQYEASVAAGVQAVARQTDRLLKACPDTILVMHGYSQGAQIIDDAFCGGPDGSALQSTSAVVSEKAASNVAAIVFMGNPRHTSGQPFSVGNATVGGFAARPAGFSCGQFENRIVSFCDAQDPFCSNGTDAVHHQGYGKEYGMQALQFIVSKMIV